MTIIEKFEQNAGSVRYAFVLLTPDDIGCEAGQKNFRPRAIHIGLKAMSLGPESTSMVFFTLFLTLSITDTVSESAFVT
jgi:Predicted nucleotide-binding protein containing TIR-like domain